MLNFRFLGKGLGLVSVSHFANDFQEKWFSCCILLTDQISLSDCLFFLKYWAICVLRLFLKQAVTSYNLKLTVSLLSSSIFLIKCYMIKKSRQKLKNLENKKSFWSENNYEKCFLFHLKSSFCSRDIQIFVFPTSPQIFPLSHWLREWFKINLKVYDVSICLNKNLITHLFDISRRKKHMTLRLCQLIEYYVRNIFMEKYAEIMDWKPVQDPFLILVNNP